MNNQERTINRGQSREGNQERTIKSGQSREDNQEIFFRKTLGQIRRDDSLEIID